jgi:hypothetical protein
VAGDGEAGGVHPAGVAAQQLVQGEGDVLQAGHRHAGVGHGALHAQRRVGLVLPDGAVAAGVLDVQRDEAGLGQGAAEIGEPFARAAEAVAHHHGGGGAGLPRAGAAAPGRRGRGRDRARFRAPR